MARPSKFKCQQCGECCGVPVFFKNLNTYEIVEKISKEFNMEFIEINHGKLGMGKMPRVSYDQLGRVRAGIIPKADCPFLSPATDGKYQCLIYENRPVFCQAFGPSRAPSFRCHKNYPTKSRTR